MNIGEASKASKVSAKMIRYYEQIGLMPEPERTGGGQRRYRDGDLDRLSFIRHARQLGFGLDAIRALLDLADNPGRSCADVDRIARGQLKEVEARIARLDALRRELERMVAECRRDTVADCRVLEVLRDHGT